jgi:hypothetical protein
MRIKAFPIYDPLKTIPVQYSRIGISERINERGGGGEKAAL